MVADASFNDLLASVTEKGVLVPILVRARAENGKQYEVVAGNRRFRAASAAGLSTIPAMVKEMTDVEAREAQIVENLQRQDIHPLEEGQAYRELIEEGKKSVKDVAIKVGRSETYVRGRLFLTNLSEPAAKAYRSGKISDSFAAVIARLTADAQKKTLKYLSESYGDVDLEDLKRFITREFSNPLSFQPWLKDEAIAKVVGPCKECPPNREDLFGKVQSGQCTDLKCWQRKITAYLKWRKEQDPELAFVTMSYGKSEVPGVITQSNFQIVGARDRCDFAEKALVVEGEDLGKTLWICGDGKCKEHYGGRSEYAPSPKEQANRKKEREREEAKRVKFDLVVSNALLKVTWPLSEKHLDALLEIALSNMSTSYLMPVLKRHDLKAEKTKDGGRDYRAPLRKLAEENEKDGKLRMIFELLLPTYSSYTESGELNKRIAKL